MKTKLSSTGNYFYILTMAYYFC